MMGNPDPAVAMSFIVEVYRRHLTDVVSHRTNELTYHALTAALTREKMEPNGEILLAVH